jgi:hypothetical protein
MMIIVVRCGFSCNTKREIIYGPMAYGGANFRHLYMHQGVGQITTFMKHWQQPTLFRANCYNVQWPGPK